MGLTAWTTVAVCAFLLGGVRSGGERRALDARSPGPAWRSPSSPRGSSGIVFPAAAIFLHCLANRDWRLLAKLEWLRGIALFLVIAAPWFVLVSMANPEFPQFFFVHEHFERFLTKAHRREEPWWYFWPILFAGFLPWMLTLVAGCDRRLAPRTRAPARSRGGGSRSSGRHSSWSSSAPRGRSCPAYILPVFPVLALVLGDWLARTPPAAPVEAGRHPRAPRPRGTGRGLGRARTRARAPGRASSTLAARPWIVAGLAVRSPSRSLAGTLALRAGRKWTGIGVIVVATLLFIDFVEDGYEALSPRQSGKVVAEMMKPAPAPRHAGLFGRLLRPDDPLLPRTDGDARRLSRRVRDRARWPSRASRSPRWRTSGATGCGRGRRWL